MGNLIHFNFNGRSVRVVMVNGEPWFVAADVCRVLELTGDPGQHVRRLEEDEKGLISIQTLGGEQNVLAVNESGLYNLVLGSRKPEAKAFKRWVTHEVLPSIRKHGMYAKEELLDNPDLLLDVIMKLREERKARLEAEARAKEMEPKAEFYDAVADSKDCQSIRDVAKVLGTGQNRLFAWLRGEKILMSNNKPYQEYMDAGYFKLIQQTWDKRGKAQLSPKTVVTGRGLTWLQKRFHGTAAQLQVAR